MKIVKLTTMMMISSALTACGPKEPVTLVTEPETISQAVETTAQTLETTVGTTAVGKEEVTAESQAGQETEGVYEDNFAVEASEAEAFAEKIKSAVAARDIEALADLTAFPVYVGIAAGGVENREAFLTLGAEKVFTPGLMESVAGADISNLSPSMAGFSISKDGKENIIFGVVEGRLAISGINYGS